MHFLQLPNRSWSLNPSGIQAASIESDFWLRIQGYDLFPLLALFHALAFLYLFFFADYCLSILFLVTPRGGRFSRAPPFVKRLQSHVQSPKPGPCSFVAVRPNAPVASHLSVLYHPVGAEGKPWSSP